MPNEFQEVEWIGNNSTAYLIIDSNYVVGDSFNTVFAMGEIGGSDKYLICQLPWNSPSNTRFGFGIHGSYYAITYGGIAGEWNRLEPNTGADANFHEWVFENGYVEITDLNIGRPISGTFATSGANQKIRIFYGYNAVRKGQIKTFIQKRDGEEIINLVPCYRKSDQEIGLYDLANDIFYTNQGTGTFMKGPEV